MGNEHGGIEALGKLEPTTLARHAEAVVAMLEDSHGKVRHAALETLRNLEPAALAHHAPALLPILEADYSDVMCLDAVNILHHGLPRFVRHGINFGNSRGRNNDDIHFYYDDSDFHDLSRRLMGHIAWYRCRIRLRVRSLSLYWYALPYRPRGPVHARDVEAWTHMIEE